jgi:V8-like Glu-specific endopeptidase
MIEKKMDEALFKILEGNMPNILHRSLGALKFRDGYGRCGYGGVSISENLMLTAAHKIYDNKLKR